MKKELIKQEIEKCIYKKSDSLYLVDLGISNLKELHRLEECINLKFLNLSHNQISKIENLEKLNKLTDLNLSHNQISKIENLENLNQLTDLNLSYNQIPKIESLEKLNKLIRLNLSYNRISKIENLENLNQLLLFNVTNNKISEIKKIDNTITHFDVIPLNEKKISFLKIIKDVEQMIKDLFFEYKINHKITLKVGAQNENGEHFDIDLNRTLNSVNNNEFIYFYIESFGESQFISFSNTPLSQLNVFCNGNPHLINYDEHLTINKIRTKNKLIHDIEQKILEAKKVDLIWNFLHIDENIILELISGLLTFYTSITSDAIIWNEKEKSDNLPDFPFEAKDFNIWFFCGKDKKKQTVKEIKRMIINLENIC